MPKLLEKSKVAGLKGDVVTYVDRASGKYFYREKLAGVNRYRSKLITGAINMDEARKRAVETALALHSEDPHYHSYLLNPKREDKTNFSNSISTLQIEEESERRKGRLKLRKRTTNRKFLNINTAIKKWIQEHKKRLKAGTLEQNSFIHKEIILRIHLKGYLDYKNITMTSQIKTKTFSDYLIYRKDTTRINQAREISVISEWVKCFLIKNRYMTENLWDKKTFMPKVEIREIDRMANPTINAQDWSTIINYISGKYLKEAKRTDYTAQRKSREYFRYLFWHWCLVAMKSGMSSEEIHRLKWKQIELKDAKRISKSLDKERIDDLQDKKIDFKGQDIDNSATFDQRSNSICKKERDVVYITSIRSKAKGTREIPCKLGTELRRLKEWQREWLAENGCSTEIRDDDHVFMNPMNKRKPIHQQRVGYNWRRVRDKLSSEGKLKGHKFSDHPYTLYSMRATFIENHLMKGTDLFFLARIAGHEIKSLMQSYERIDYKERDK